MIRFITAAAVVVMAVGAAAAQTATGDTAGKPVSLLQVLSPPATATPAKPHAKYATRHTRRWAKKSHERATDTAAEPDQPATDAANASPANAPAASAWASNAAPLPGVANDATAPTVIPAIDQNLSELVVGGRTVQIAAPDEANAIDLAADHQTITSAADTQAAAAPQASAVALAQPDDPQRDTWYEELLATLGGALAAGLVAWFLIMGGGPPQRMYG
jgi:hypothetical protein